MLYRIAKREDQAAKKILLASVEAEKKLRQTESVIASANQTPKEEQSKIDHPITKKHSEVAMIKLRLPNGKVTSYCNHGNLLWLGFCLTK